MNKTFVATLLILWTIISSGCMTTWPIVDNLNNYKKWDTYETIRNNDEWILDVEEVEDVKEVEEIEENLLEPIEDMEEVEENISLWEDHEDYIVCTADVKQCEDGSYVSRWWPNCEFWPCPSYELDEK